MATTSYGVNHELAVKLWAKKLFAESLKQTAYSELMGTGSDSVIQIRSETNKSEGDRVRIGLRMQLSGDGVSGDNTLEGSEEALTTYSDDVMIDQLRHAVRSAGEMSEQRVPFSVRDEARNGLQDWWSDRLDSWFFNQVCGYVPQTNVKYTGMQSVSSPGTASQVFAGSATNDQGLTASDTMTLATIDKAVVLAKTRPSIPLRPATIRGRKLYVMFLHPYQVRDLRQASAGQTWMDIQRALVQGGLKDERSSPIYAGGEMVGIYNGVLLLENTRVTQGVNSSTNVPVPNVRRAVLLGAQAAAFAYGKRQSSTEMTWVERLFDYDNELGVSAGMIAGLKKLRFNGIDHGTIVTSTYAAA